MIARAAFLSLLGVAGSALAAGLNTDVALTPPRGGTILRAQARHVRLENDRTALQREVDLYLQTTTVVHGVTERFALLGTVPLLHRDLDFGSGASQDDTGVADLPLLAKYRFFQRDEPGKTTRWAAIGGVEVASFDDTFSSESFDPIVGVVFTHQRLDGWVDWDLLYKVNTGGGLDADDELRADVAYSRRFLAGQSDSLGPWGLYAIAEVNARYLTDGSAEVLGSPGLQFITPRWILEAGVQLPLARDMTAPRLETGLTVVLSARFQF